MSEGKKLFWSKWSHFLADGLVVLICYAGAAYVREAIAKDLKGYVPIDRYERERREHQSWGDANIEVIRSQFNELKVDRKSQGEKLTDLATEVRVISALLAETNKKVDDIHRHLIGINH